MVIKDYRLKNLMVVPDAFKITQIIPKRIPPSSNTPPLATRGTRGIRAGKTAKARAALTPSRGKNPRIINTAVARAESSVVSCKNSVEILGRPDA